MAKSAVFQELEVEVLLKCIGQVDKSVASALSFLPKDIDTINNYVKVIAPSVLETSQKLAASTMDTIQKGVPELSQLSEEHLGHALQFILAKSPGILDQAFSFASSDIPGIVGNILESGAVQDALKTAGAIGMQAAGELAKSLPFLGPLGSIVGAIGTAMQSKSANDRQLKKIHENINEIFLNLSTYSHKLVPLLEKRPGALQPLISSMNEVHELILKVNNRNGLFKLLTSQETQKRLSEYDNNVTRAMQTLQSQMNFEMLPSDKLNQRMQDSTGLDELKALIEGVAKQREEGQTLDPNDLKKISEMCNESYETVADEMSLLRTEMKLEFQHNRSMQDKILESTLRTNQQLDNSKNFAHDRLNEQEEKLKRVMAQQDRQGVSMYSDVKQTAYLATRTGVCVSANEPFLLVHCKGVGFDSLDNRDGFHGRDADTTAVSYPAQSGNNGAAGMPGGHAMKGVAGENGRDATHGSSGKDAENFEVHLSVESRTEDEVVYSIKTVHGYEIEESRVQVKKKTRIIIHGSGGNGGNG